MADDAKELLIRVSATTELLRSQLIQAEQKVSSFTAKVEGQLGKVDSRFDRLGAGLSKLNGKFASAAASAGGFIAAIGVAGIGAAAARALDYASSLGEVAQQLGVTTKDLQEYRYAASQAGISQEEMDKALAKLTVNIGKAATGSKAQAEAFGALGISVRNANGDVRTAGEIIPELADKLAGVKDPATRAAVEIELFGKSGQKLDTLLSGGSKAIRQFADEANRAGLILSEELIQNADAAADALGKVRQTIETKMAAAVAENADAIIGLGDALGYAAGKAIDGAGAIGTFFKTMEGVKKLKRDEGFWSGFLSSPSEQMDATDPQKYLQRRRWALLDAQTKLQAGLDARKTGGISGAFGAGADPAIQQLISNVRRETGALQRATAEVLSASTKKTVAASGATSAEVLNLNDFSAAGGRGGSKQNVAEDPVAKMLGSVDVAIRNSTAAAQELYKVIGVKEEDLLKRQLERIDNVAKAEYDERSELMERLNQQGRAQVEVLARLFEDGFRGGVGAIWKDFEKIGLEVISMMLAQMVTYGGSGASFGGMLSAAFSNVLGFADGGNPPVGRVSIVGERGPELFVPKVPGTIVPNHALVGGQTTPLVVNISAPGATAETVARIRAEIAAAAPTLIAAATQNTARTMTRKRLP